jgi:hypothetical protein
MTKFLMMTIAALFSSVSFGQQYIPGWTPISTTAPYSDRVKAEVACNRWIDSERRKCEEKSGQFQSLNGQWGCHELDYQDSTTGQLMAKYTNAYICQ